MANLRGRRRQRINDMIDLTEDSKRKPTSQANPDIIDLTCEETPTNVAGAVRLDRLSSFRCRVAEEFFQSRQQQVSVQRLTEVVNTNNDEIFSGDEIEAALIQMTEANQVMVSDGVVYLI